MFTLRKPTVIQTLVSCLIAGLGLFASQTLGRVDQDLRSMYTEYTVAATDLAHMSSDLLRYRVTIIRAIEAPTQKEFERITATLPDQRARIYLTLNRFAAASRQVSLSHKYDRNLDAFRGKLDAYFSSAEQTRRLLIQLWTVPLVTAISELRDQTEIHAAEHAGPKLVEASDALDRLLISVAEVGKDIRDEGAGMIRTTSLILVLGSLVIAAANLLP
jgi:hypothetical protein